MDKRDTKMRIKDDVIKIPIECRREAFEKVDKQRLYNAIKDVLKDGNYTAREIASILFKKGITISSGRQSVAPRLTELKKKGIVEEVEKKYDTLTKVNVSVYKLKDN